MRTLSGLVAWLHTRRAQREEVRRSGRPLSSYTDAELARVVLHGYGGRWASEELLRRDRARRGV